MKWWVAGELFGLVLEVQTGSNLGLFRFRIWDFGLWICEGNVIDLGWPLIGVWDFGIKVIEMMQEERKVETSNPEPTYLFPALL